MAHRNVFFRSFLVAFLLPISGLIWSQANLVEFPYNPDADGDDFIGTSDLLSLLSLYDSFFSEEGLYVNEDSTAALVYLGLLSFPKCAYNCQALPGNWGMSTLEDLGMIWDDLPPVMYENGTTLYTTIWLKGYSFGSTQVVSLTNAPTNTANSGWKIRVSIDSDNLPSHTFRCYCSITERPKVEYSYCIGNGGTDIQPCFDEKSSNGWYPHGSIEFRPDGSPAQGFWRWAE